MVLGASLSYCAIMLIGRWLGTTESTFTIIFYMTLGTTTITGITSIFIWQPIPLQDVGLIAAMAILSLSGNICLIEWPGIIDGLLPSQRLEIQIDHHDNEMRSYLITTYE